MSNKKNSRRTFLKQCALLNAAGYTGLTSALGSLSLTAQAQSVTRPSRYRAMVCIYLTGGNDLNMLMPTDDDSYDPYVGIRGEEFSLSREEDGTGRDVFLPISSGSGSNQKPFGLHPACGVVDSRLGDGSGGFKKLYDEGNLSFIANAGALVEPTTAESFSNGSVLLPPQLFSHLTQKDFVRAGATLNGTVMPNGWAGRIADLYDNGGSPLSLSFSGDNIWQRGARTKAYGFAGASVPQLVGYRPIFEEKRRAALNRVNKLKYDNLFVNEYAQIIDDSLELSSSLRDGAAIRNIELTTEFPNTRLGGLMKNVANLINARDGLSMPQQTFYINSNGWDHHSDLLSRHSDNLEELSSAMAAFYAATVEMGLQDDVVTFTNTEFGRTLDPNSTGSDHAWGGNQVVMGGAIKGGQVFGDYPVFSPEDPQFREFRGTLIPSISSEQINSTIAKWFGGFNDSTLRELFPTLRSFDEYDLGFIS